ncbi:MAG: sialate O-acetylesterase, partial [Ginsengibacter sp.]
MNKLLMLAFSFSTALYCSADIRLPKFFRDSMVLQRDQVIPIWGWAAKNEKVTVQFGDQKKVAVAGKDGKWRINLDKMGAGGPFTLLVSGKNLIALKDILIGDVWLCSGQSNMEYKVNGVLNAKEEIAASTNPNIRHIEIPKAVSGKPENDISQNATWRSASPASTGNFTAVGYFFAKKLYDELKVPIGLIHSSWGGTDIEPWTSRYALEKSDEFKSLMKKIPSINLDSLNKVFKEKLTVDLQKWQGGLPDATIVNSWKQFSFDDGSWHQMTVPSIWETQGLTDIDGIVWFRKNIILFAADAGKEGTLELSLIDDIDDTYINGVKIGSTSGYNIARKYKIPTGILKEGKNVIAVRINDTGGGGGMYGPASDMKITVNQRSQSLAGQWKYRIASVVDTKSSVAPNSYPTLLFNAMINPLIPYAIKGALWYQGENNASRAYQYRSAFPLMINDWRQHWGEGNFPFYFVQLASFNAANGNSQKGSAWAELREAQTLTLSLPHTGMAVITDIGMADDIHPKNKQDVGKRLAAIALHDAYGKNIVYGGPTY